MLEEILSNLRLGKDGVYSYEFKTTEQDDEIKLRESVASRDYQNYLEELSYHHSVPVMDKEVDLFLKRNPKNGIIVDVGGCWGWHWRRISNARPDITVFIVDFVRSNFIHAKNILGDQINNNIFLVHGDATCLIFEENAFDGWWSVQTLQHIPNFKKAVSEAWRVLKPGGVFANYSLNNQALIKLIYEMKGRQCHTKDKFQAHFIWHLHHRRLLVICHTFQEENKDSVAIRIFSSRKAIKKESRLYGE